MKKSDVIEHFGGIQQTADALGIRYQSVYEWPDVVPEGRQYQIQIITGGKLKVIERQPAA